MFRPFRLARLPLAAWIVLAVAVVHLLFFWAVSDKHFLPKAHYVPPAPAPNFGARQTVTVDLRTGEKTIRQDFVVSTRLLTPPPYRATPSPAPSR